MIISTSFIWLLLGALMLAVEAFGVSGIGFFFAGLAALCVGILVEAGVTGSQAYGLQAAWWFGLTALWAVILWKPLQKLRMSKQSQEYSNMVGEIAIVEEAPLTRGSVSKSRWSGTTMHTQLSASATQDVAVGAKVKIVAVKGSTLIVEPV